MSNLMRRIDQLLRADTARSDFADRLVPLRVALLGCAVLGLVAGACTGVYAVANHETVNLAQLVASAVKIPLLFLLTLVVTFPSLYVFSALLGVELYPPALLRMILSAIVVTLALAASFGPISAFFALSTENYHFIVVLTIVVYGFGGLLGLVFLLRALRSALERQDAARATAQTHAPVATAQTVADGEDAPAGDEADRGGEPQPPAIAPPVSQNERIATILFRIWVIVYGLVGAQMAWVLRPFIGDPDADFQLFRARDSNFFQSALGHLRDLLF